MVAGSSQIGVEPFESAATLKELAERIQTELMKGSL